MFNSFKSLLRKSTDRESIDLAKYFLTKQEKSRSNQFYYVFKIHVQTKPI